MMKLFDRNDAAYLDWIDGHPQGFVINTRRDNQTGYVKLHRATCKSVRLTRYKYRNPDPFTGRAYIKICADLISEFDAWKGQHRIDDLKACGHCQPGMTRSQVGYWILVCNPKKWAIDRFLQQGVSEDSWGVRPSDKDHFARGQLALVRVGVDGRSNAARHGGARLAAGIYALCQIEGMANSGTGAHDAYWAKGQNRSPGWPTVKIRYLQNFIHKPLSIETLRKLRPEISPLLLNGFQAASFPVSRDDFMDILTLLDVDLDTLPLLTEMAPVTLEGITELESLYRDAVPEVRERVSRRIERGPIGNQVKEWNDWKCQICAALGHEPIGFLKVDRKPYVEAHHVMPVSMMQVGLLAPSNIITVCANHHRQLHYGGIEYKDKGASFSFQFPDALVEVTKCLMSRQFTFNIV